LPTPLRNRGILKTEEQVFLPALSQYHWKDKDYQKNSDKRTGVAHSGPGNLRLSLLAEKKDSQADPQHTLDIATAASFRT